MNASADITYTIIDNPDKLDRLAATLEKRAAIGVDLEADSMYHFKEKVCLIQIAAKDINAVIDPLLIDDLSALKPIFKKQDIQKIFHGADYDVRSLFRDFKITINNLFDTELASRFLGFGETGLEAVLKKKFAVVLDKKYQRKDWSKRPLTRDMMAYAAKDVGYLLPLAKQLEAELEQKGRLKWVYEECRHLSLVRPNTGNAAPLYMNFKGAGSLDPRSLAVLESLLTCRREVALKKDRPLFRVFAGYTLLDLALKKPINLRQLEETGALSAKQISMYGPVLIERIKAALKIPKKSLPLYPRKKAPRVPLAVAERVRTLRQWRDKKAKQLAIDPALICTKALISTIAVQRPLNLKTLGKINDLKNWQIDEFGKDIVAVLGKIA